MTAAVDMCIRRDGIRFAIILLQATVPLMMSEGGSIVLASAAISHLGEIWIMMYKCLTHRSFAAMEVHCMAHTVVCAEQAHDGPSCAATITGAANHDVVAAAKGAVSSLAVSAASTYSPHNIRINCVAPGLIRQAKPCVIHTAPILFLQSAA